MAIQAKALDALHLSQHQPQGAGAGQAVSESQAAHRFAVDRWHAAVARGAQQMGQGAEAFAGQGPLGQVVQFGVGAASGLLAIPNSLWQVLRHPVATLQGLWAMLSQLPLSPMWLLRALQVGPVDALKESGAFWAQVGKAWVAPFQEELKAGRHAAFAGRLTVELGLLLLGARQAKAALDGRKAAQAAKLAPRAQAMGQGTKAGQQVGQNAQVVAQATSPGVKGGQVSAKAQRLSKPSQMAQALPEGKILPQGGRALEASEVLSDGAKLLGRPARQLRASRTAGSTATRTQAFRKARNHRVPRPRRLPEEVTALTEQRIAFRKLRMLGPDSLKQNTKLQRSYQTFVDGLDHRMDTELEALLGHRPQGLPKRPDRAAEKLHLWREVKDQPNLRLGSLDDIARGRLDLDRLDVGQIRAMHERLKATYGPERLKVNDYLQGSPMYRGRLHVKIKDTTGAWYELQIGPKQLSQFYETPMRVAGRNSNLHDLVYKGVLRLEPEAIKHLGGGQLAAGQARIDALVGRYQSALNQTIEAAEAGRALPAGLAQSLHGELDTLLGALPESLLPQALLG